MSSMMYNTVYTEAAENNYNHLQKKKINRIVK